jgi:hypothetical protein
MAEIAPGLGRTVIVDETARGVLPLLQLPGAPATTKEVKP